MERQSFHPASKSRPIWAYRMRGFQNLLRMGHCAPTVMQTILDVSGTDKEWLVRLSGGMPGGIGNTGFECGGLTSPLALMGIRYGLGPGDHDLPAVFEKGHALCQQFHGCHKTLNCSEIRRNDHFPSARAVFTQLGYAPSELPELFDAASAYVCGTLFMGKTCSAFTAGVMAAGLRAGEIENSVPRVIWLLGLMTVGGNAFDERVNKFNRSMNWGYRLSEWFAKEFGSTQCQAITQCDFSSQEGVSNYIERDQISLCRSMAERVAERVQNEVPEIVRFAESI